MTAPPPPFRLLAFGPAWGAPSMDAACTKVTAWMRFCGLREGIDFSIEACSPHIGLSGERPVLEMPDRRLAEPHEIFASLAEIGHDPDASLTAGQKAESLAFTALIEERLHVALLFSWWEEEANYDAVVRPALAASLPIPLCYYLPWSLRRRVHSQLARRRCLSADVAYAMGEAALAALSERLGARDYFHGNTPSGVDASAFAYLTAVLRPPMPDDRLRRAMQTHANLVEYCDRVASAHFARPPALLPPVPRPTLSGARPRAMDARSVAEAAAAAEREAAAKGGRGAPQSAGGSEELTKEKRQQRRSRNAVMTAVGGAIVYALAVDTFGRQEDDDDNDDDG